MVLKLKTYTETWNQADILRCFEALSNMPYSLFFDSNDTRHPLSQYSIICWSPRETISYSITDDQCPFDLIQSRLNKYKIEASNIDLPFIGGLAGYWGYDLGQTVETLPNIAQRDINVPDMMVGIYTNCLVHDHTKNEMRLIIHAEDNERFEQEKKFLIDKISSKKETKSQDDNINWQSSVSEDDYKKNVQRIIDYIYAGDVYQVNLTRRFDAKKPKNFDAFEHYKTLREHNPAPFSAFMNFSDVKLASCSPERFLSVNDNIVETRPIKGTISDIEDPETLSKSTKDRAENIMIVDLLRNDISKVSKPHSVKVTDLCKVETFKGLHHLVSTVTGELDESKSSIDLLKNCFPGGSITGAPKIRAMEIIEELEPIKRGPYCGAMGYIGFNQNMDTNISIRTLIYTQDKIYLQAGGGITCESTPAQELQETYTKINKIFESFDLHKEQQK